MDDDTTLTAEEQAALDAQRNAAAEEPVQEAPETPQEGAEAPEGQAEGEQQPSTDKRPQMVPHAALHEERERRKETERKLAELERRSEERFNAILQRFQPPAAEAKPTEPAIPDVQQDPVGHIVGTMQRQGASLEQINQWRAQYQQQQEQQQALAFVQQRAVAAEAEYRQEAPDYDDAVEHLKKFRDRQLIAFGLTDPAQRQVVMMQEAVGVTVKAIQDGANPAERLYRMAEASGYVKAAPAEQSAAGGDTEQKIQTIARGQQMARSVGTARGTGPSPMTAEKLLKMNDKDFLKWAQESPDAKNFLGR